MRSRISDLPSSLKGNHECKVTCRDSVGTREFTFHQVHEDCLRLAFEWERSGRLPTAPAIWAIVGRPCYEWLLSALVCIGRGVRVIALPEDLPRSELTSWCEKFNVEGLFSEGDEAICEVSHTFKDYDLSISIPQDYNPFNCDSNAEGGLVAFTSGTSGTSKLKAFDVQLRSTESFIAAFQEIFNLQKGCSWLVCHSFSHIVHFEYVLGCLISGFNIILTSPIDFAMNWIEINATVIVTVPLVYEMLLKRIASLSGMGSYVHAGNSFKVMIIGAANSRLELKKALRHLGFPLFEGYGMSETNMIACNAPDAARLGSVGKLWPGVAARIDSEGVLQVVVKESRAGHYYFDAAQSADVFLDDGWISTGDCGHFDDDGFLFIDGRRKNLIVMSSGKKVNPEPLEEVLRSQRFSNSAVVVGDGEGFLAALIPVEKRDPFEENVIYEFINGVNGSLADHEKLRRLQFVECSSELISQLRTRSGKVRRQFVIETFGKEIRGIYHEGA